MRADRGARKWSWRVENTEREQFDATRAREFKRDVLAVACKSGLTEEANLETGSYGDDALLRCALLQMLIIR